jgi:hypothetical protein
LALTKITYQKAMWLWGRLCCGWDDRGDPKPPPMESLSVRQLQHLAAKIQDSYGRQDPYGRSEGK